LSGEQFVELFAAPPRPLPDAFVVSFSMVADNDAPDFLPLLRGAAGPSGIRQIARFCTDDDELTGYARDHVTKEEALSPDCLYADVVHLPRSKHQGLRYRYRY
jgi:lantibiotic biosynthesis protein